VLILARGTALVVLVLSVIGFAAAVALDLPAQFVSGTTDHEVGMTAVWEGTALSAPVPPLVVLLLGRWLTTWAGWQLILGTVQLALVEAVMAENQPSGLGTFRRGCSGGGGSAPLDEAREAGDDEPDAQGEPHDVEGQEDGRGLALEGEPLGVFTEPADRRSACLRSCANPLHEIAR
jgi:hypothetical protein